MSLNWREIDQILFEIDIAGAIIRDIIQPTYYELILECYRPGENFNLFIGLRSGECRLHITSHRYAKPSVPPRFMEFLRARIRNRRITMVKQHGQDRIVELTVGGGDEALSLWIRLWSGVANIIAADCSRNILEAFYRRPQRKEMHGERFEPPTSSANDSPSDKYVMREYPVAMRFNDYIDQWYFEREQNRTMLLLRQRATKRLTQKISRLQSLITNRRQGDWQREIEMGQAILANSHAIKSGDRQVTAQIRGETQTIPINPEYTAIQNAEHRFLRAKKIRTAIQRNEIYRKTLDDNIDQANCQLQAIDSMDSRALRRLVGNYEETHQRTEKILGLRFHSQGYHILVGRNARENDQLLRRNARGNDIWLHIKGHAGGYIFIKSRRGKSAPLDTLLDAANLALFYSKARKHGEGEVCYTPVKYLRRPKKGKLGVIQPIREKHLSITLDERRLVDLRARSAMIDK